MKYKFTKKTKVVFGVKLKQIQATKSFGMIAKSEIGGWIESKKNLGEDGSAWVSGNARVYGDAKIKTTVLNLIASCEFNVTSYNKYIQFGCYLHTITEWKKILKSNKTYRDDCSSDTSYQQCRKTLKYVIETMKNKEQ